MTDANNLRITQRRPMSAFLVSLDPYFYDRAAEHEIIHKLRSSGGLLNGDAYGNSWLDGADQFAETRWRTYWRKHRRYADLPRPAQDHGVALTVDPKLRQQQIERRIEMKAARAAVQAEYDAEQERRQAEIEKRRERWQQDQAEWDAAIKHGYAAQQARERSAPYHQQRQQQQAEQEHAQRERLRLQQEHAEWEAAVRKFHHDEANRQRESLFRQFERQNQEFAEITQRHSQRELVKYTIFAWCQRHGGNIEYSEVAEALGYDYELVAQLCDELIREGRAGGEPR